MQRSHCEEGTLYMNWIMCEHHGQSVVRVQRLSASSLQLAAVAHNVWGTCIDTLNRVVSRCKLLQEHMHSVSHVDAFKTQCDAPCKTLSRWL
jgi:hypothetical protein